MIVGPPSRVLDLGTAPGTVIGHSGDPSPGPHVKVGRKVPHLRRLKSHPPSWWVRRGSTLPSRAERAPAAGPEGPLSGMLWVASDCAGPSDRFVARRGWADRLSRGLAGGLFGLGERRAGSGGEVLVAQAVAVAFQGEDLGVVDEAVDHRGGHDVVAEDLTPT